MQGEKATRTSVNPHRLRWTISSPIDPKEGIFQEKKKISLRLKIVEKSLIFQNTFEISFIKICIKNRQNEGIKF